MPCREYSLLSCLQFLMIYRVTKINDLLITELLKAPECGGNKKENLAMVLTDCRHSLLLYGLILCNKIFKYVHGCALWGNE